nr:orf153 3' of petH - Synechococcus sp. (PCC 7002) [Synechococcus sp.]AAA27324.1 ORF [Synechococcus sp.]
MFDRSLNRVNERLNRTLTRNQLLHRPLIKHSWQLRVSRVVIYYFYREWKGQVIIESLSQSEFSILGPRRGPMIVLMVIMPNGISKAESYKLQILRQVILTLVTWTFTINSVRADLVAPIIVDQRLWGLLAAHHHEVRTWLAEEVEFVRQQAKP